MIEKNKIKLIVYDFDGVLTDNKVYIDENEKGIEKLTGEIRVEVNPIYFRPTEVDVLLGDPSKARKDIGWSQKTSFEELVKIMVQADWEKVKKRRY